MAKLSGGVTVIKVGAETETAMKDRKYKMEDAINSTKAAVEEGIVPGGGTTLAHLSPKLEAWGTQNITGKEHIGAMIVARALYAPIRQIADNAGQNRAIITSHLKEKEFAVGYDAITNQYVNLFEAGIVDPAKVTRRALQNATSIAAMTLTTGCIIAEKPEDIDSHSISTPEFDY